MISYYAWSILITFVVGFGVVSGLFLVSKYFELQEYCKKLQHKIKDIEKDKMY